MATVSPASRHDRLLQFGVIPPWDSSRTRDIYRVVLAMMGRWLAVAFRHHRTRPVDWRGQAERLAAMVSQTEQARRERTDGGYPPVRMGI